MFKDKAYIKHIEDAIEAIETYAKGVDRDEFLDKNKNKMIKDAIIRQFEIIGEAVGRLSEEIKKEHPELPWKEISSMRNKLIHEYFAVDLAVIWKTIEDDLPILKQTIKSISFIQSPI